MRVLANLLFPVLLLLVFSVASAQSVVPSAQQIEQFKKLPKAQQEQLAKQMGVDLSMLKAGTSTGGLDEEDIPDIEIVEREVDEEEISKELAKQSVLEDKASALKPFGYEIFAAKNTSWQPPANTPVPADYILAPGDTLILQLFGKESGEYELMVNNEGNIDIPDLGPLTITGNSYQDAKTLIKEKYSQQKIGVKPFLSMGKLRTIQVYMVGEVFRPGTLTVSGLSTITTALVNGGGVSLIGSLRNIELKRGGKTIQRFDLYDLIVNGNTSSDVRLQQGDVIFVPTIKSVVSIDGLVRRPAIYEITKGETIADLLSLAGGVLPNANKNAIQIVRNDPAVGLSLLNVDLSRASSLETNLVDGDFVNVEDADLEFDNAIKVSGAINSPIIVSVAQNNTLSDIVNMRSLLRNTDLDYGLLVRRAKFDDKTQVIQFVPRNVVSGEQNMALQALDQIILFSRVAQDKADDIEEQVAESDVRSSGESSQTAEAVFLQEQETQNFTTKELSKEASSDYSRKKLLAPLIARLKSEASDKHPLALVDIHGQVRFPGTYPLSDTNNIASLIKAAGGLTESAHLESAEITSLVSASGRAEVQHIRVSLADELNKPQYALQSKDAVNIVRIADWYDSNAIELRGEVVFPGTYQLSKGETLSSVIARAGGLTAEASINAAVFTRDELRIKEQENLKKALSDLRQQMATANLSTSQFSKSVDYDTASKVIEDLSEVEPVGRLVIDLASVVSNKSDIELKDGDMLVIPNITPAVSVIGEVYVPTTHWYDDALDVSAYVERSGGVKDYGDDSKIYIVRADGSVYVPHNNYWFDAGAKQDVLRPGDTIVVPRDLAHYDNLSLWQGVTQIVYQTAVALAAIGSL